jgi:hypothetical protein
MKDLPSSILPISISLYTPKGVHCYQYDKLRPTRFVLLSCEDDGDQEKYIERFNNTTLLKLKQQEVYDELAVIGNRELIGATDICLLCYEKPDDFCHRHLIAKWFAKAGIDVVEYIYTSDKEEKNETIFRN